MLMGEMLSLGAVGLNVLLKFTLIFLLFFFVVVFKWWCSPLLSAVSAKWIFRKWMVGRRGRLTALPEANDFIVEHQASVVYTQTSAPPRRADSSHSTRAKRFLEARPLLSPPLPRDKRFPRISCTARLNG